MKKLIIILLSGIGLIPARAQWLHPEAVQGAFLGGLIGGIAGSHHHAFSGRNAALGAGVGLLAGTLMGEANRSRYDYGTTFYADPAVSLNLGYGYYHHGRSVYVGYTPGWYRAPRTDYRATRPNYAVSGTVLGAASGALIGAASHHAGQGAIIGAAAGLVVGGVTEAATIKRERAEAQNVNPQVETVSTFARPPEGASHQITSQPSRTSTYYWTPRPQIADAPRVPNAPTF